MSSALSDEWRSAQREDFIQSCLPVHSKAELYFLHIADTLQILQSDSIFATFSNSRWRYLSPTPTTIQVRGNHKTYEWVAGRERKRWGARYEHREEWPKVNRNYSTAICASLTCSVPSQVAHYMQRIVMRRKDHLDIQDGASQFRSFVFHFLDRDPRRLTITWDNAILMHPWDTFWTPLHWLCSNFIDCQPNWPKTISWER